MYDSNEVVISAIVLVAGGVLCIFLAKSLQVKPVIAAILFIWHSFLGYFFSNYIFVHGGDALDFYERARFAYVEPSFSTEFFGTPYISWLASFPASLGITYWPIAFLFSVAGAVGLIFFYALLKENTKSSQSLLSNLLILLCCFIPSLSFWTSGIGKDALAFLSVALFLWAASSFGRRQVVAIVAVLIMLPVRPHIAVLMVVSVGIGIIFVKDLRTTVRFGMGAIATAAAAFVVPLALIYSGTARFSTLAEYISDRQEKNLGGGSSIDISSMSPALRLWSYLYRPLPNEAASLEQLAASLDNVILIALTVVGIAAVYRAGIIKVFRHYSIPLIYGIMALVMLSQVTANLGLAARQKWMALPALMLVVVGAWGMAAEQSGRRRRRPRPMVVMTQAQP